MFSFKQAFGISISQSLDLQPERNDSQSEMETTEEFWDSHWWSLSLLCFLSVLCGVTKWSLRPLTKRLTFGIVKKAVENGFQNSDPIR